MLAIKHSGDIATLPFAGSDYDPSFRPTHAGLVVAAVQVAGQFGKAYGHAGDSQRALHELDLAKILDPGDPTAWLYSALLNQESHRFNEGIRDLEQSQELNDKRQLFRSRLLLDRDRAVRSANLASLYQDVGMADWSVREASRAVTSDQADASAHLFLASSYDALLDPRRVSLRYETLALTETLLADLLTPVSGSQPLIGAVILSQGSGLFSKAAGPVSQPITRDERDLRPFAKGL